VTVAKSGRLDYSEWLVWSRQKVNSTVAFVGPGQLKNHHGILNNADSTWAFRVVGRATGDVSVVQFFTLLCKKGIELQISLSVIFLF
jgi:hypothetical protein